MPTINAGFAGNGGPDFDHPVGALLGQHLEPPGPAFAFHRQALRHRRAFRQHAVELRVMPARRKAQGTVTKRVAIDQAGERGERQVGAIDRMGEQQRVARRRLDVPETVEFDDEAVLVEKW